MKKIFILILNYNGYENTINCLKSLKKLRTKDCRLFTIVIDNGSSSKSVNQLSVISSHLGIKKIILNPQNLGFAGGNNVGIRYALKNKADYILLLNNDTIVEQNFLPSLIASGLDISAPVIKFIHDDKLVYDYGGLINWWTGRTTHLNTSEKRKAKSEKFNGIDLVSGTCMLIKRKVFEKIGLFDESYFFYYEDVDFCVRARNAGFSISVIPTVSIFHILSDSIGRWSNKAIFFNLKGNFIFISKHLGWRKIIGYTYLVLLTVKITTDKIASKL